LYDVLKIIVMKFVFLLFLPLIFLTYGIQNIPEVDAATACSLTHLNEFIMKSAEPKICERVNYWVHYECGRVPGMYLTDERCQPPAGFPLERLAASGSFMELNLDKKIYKMGDVIQVYGNVYSSVGLPTENLGVRITNSDGQKILEQKNNFDITGKFGFNILTGTNISINEEGNYEMYVVHYGKYGSAAIKKFTVSNDGLPIVVPTVVTPPPTPVPTVITPPPTPIQEPEPFATSWMTIVAILIVGAVAAYPIYRKVTGSGLNLSSTNYSHTREEQYDDSNNKETPHDHSKESKDPMYPTYADLKNNFARFGWKDAEDLTAKLFKSKGYSTTVGVPTKDGGRKRNGDFGIDVRAYNGIVNIGIQVKHQVENVDFDAVAKTLGVAQKFQKVIIVSTKSGFSAQSLEHARNNSDAIELWDSDRFKEEIKKHLIEKDNSQFEEPEPQQKSNFNYYEILGASRDDTQDEIKQKYKDLSLKFHPDKAKSALSENMMKQVNEAYAVLRDADKRRQYDSELDSV
jgi:hypothetical protein